MICCENENRGVIGPATGLGMQMADVPIANPATVFQEGEAGWAALVNLDVVSSLALNPTGIIVWELIDGKRTVEDIVEAVRNRFEDVPDSVTADVMELLDQLGDDGFVGYEWTGE